MAVLNAKQRRKSAVIREKRKTASGETATDYKFPIPDEAHARAALARLNQAKPPLSSEEKAKVRRKAYAKLGRPPSS